MDIIVTPTEVNMKSLHYLLCGSRHSHHVIICCDGIPTEFLCMSKIHGASFLNNFPGKMQLTQKEELKMVQTIM